ncbi:MAG: DUF523 domain-containing protein, partial [Myxococcales bacterium]
MNDGRPGERRLRVGVSACLTGQQVRFDGQGKRDGYVAGVLGRYLELVPVCPEVAIGLGVPRETVRLRQTGGDVRLVGNRSGADVTEPMLRFARRCVDALAPSLSGFVLKSDSPTCGMERVRVYPPEDGRAPRRDGVGLFARVLLDRHPLLPVEEEGRLHDQGLRENFVTRLFAYDRLRQFFEQDWTVGQLVAFHAE